MKRYISILLILILISATGCETVPTKFGTPSQLVISRPLLTRWEMVGNPMVTQDDFTCLINGFYFSSNRILVFYSLFGSTSDKLSTGEIFQIIDDSGAVSQLIQIIPLGIIDQLELGMMVYAYTNQFTISPTPYNACTSPELHSKTLTLPISAELFFNQVNHIDFGFPQA